MITTLGCIVRDEKVSQQEAGNDRKVIPTAPVSTFHPGTRKALSTFRFSLLATQLRLVVTDVANRGAVYQTETQPSTLRYSE